MATKKTTAKKAVMPQKTDEQPKAPEQPKTDEQPKAAAKERAAKKVAALKVTCTKDSFYRAGRRWTKKPIEVALDDLTKEQVAQIQAEPMLVVEEVELSK